MPSIWNHIPPPSNCRVLDLGCMTIPGEPHFYEPLNDVTGVEVVGIDMLGEAIANNDIGADKSNGPLEIAIGDGGEATFFRCKLPSCSSLFPPDDWTCSQFSEISPYVDVVATSRVRTVRLDDVPGICDMDWIKMDLQGGELDAVRGGGSTFGNAVVIQTEVRFLEQYKGQPLFTDLDRALKDIGFDFHCFLGYGSRPLMPVVPGRDPRLGYKQWLWADAVYLPPLRNWAELPSEKLARLALILHEAYHSYDFAHRALRVRDERDGTSHADTYFAMLTRMQRNQQD